MKLSKILISTILCVATAISADAYDINVNVSSKQYQHITGFGAAAMGDLMCPIQDTTIIAKLYGSESPVGLNIMRIEISPNLIGDVTTPWDTPYDWHGYINAVKCAKHRGAIIFGTPWSPPAVYKTNNLTSGEDSAGVGGRLRTDKYKNFFPWLNTFCIYMKNNGAAVDIVSIQNEPDWKVSYSGCLYTPSEMHTLVRDYASRLTGAKLMGGESFWYNPAYTDSLLNDSNTCKYINYIGGHFYGSGVKYAPIAASTAMDHGVEAWETEHFVDPRNDDSMGDNKVYDSPIWSEQIMFAKEVNEAMVGNLSAYVYWYMRANHAFLGDGKTVASGSGNEDMQITKRGYVMSHFTKNVTGSTRLGATITASSVMETSAYIKGDSLIVMVINSNAINNSLNVVFNLPYVVKSCIRTTTTDSLTCEKQNLEISEPTSNPKFPLSPSSINTYVFTIDWDATGISRSSVITDPVYTDVYTIEGIKIRSKVLRDKATEGLKKGLYIINGKKVLI
jgi:glucuronoarabinoxylan endo-1,4-beta-xylanase